MRKQKIVLEEYPVECLFEFVREDYLLVLVGYPFLRAYIYSLDKSFRIEIFPSINVENNTIEFPKSSNRTSAQ